MKKIVPIMLIILIMVSLTACSSDPNGINGKYAVNGYQISSKGEYVYTWEPLENSQFYVVIEKAKIVEVYLNGSSYTGNFDGKGSSYNTRITWGYGNGPAEKIFDAFYCTNTNIGFSGDDLNELHLTFYLSLSSTSDWSSIATLRFEKVEE